MAAVLECIHKTISGKPWSLGTATTGGIPKQCLTGADVFILTTLEQGTLHWTCTQSNLGNADGNNLLEVPLQYFHDPNNRRADTAWNGNIEPGADRVVFDTTGRFAGVITHRGEVLNNFRWGYPSNINGGYMRDPDVPGIPAAFAAPYLGFFDKGF